MEAIETAAAFSEPPSVIRGDYLEARRHADALDPNALPVCNTATMSPREFVDDWVIGSKLRSGQTVVVPAAAVYLGLTATPPWYVSSNGLASGNSLTEAVSHGLAEVIERDALCLHGLAVAPEPARAFLRVLAEPPPGPKPVRLPDARTCDDFPNVDLETLPDPIREVCRAVEATGARIVLRDITSD